MRVILWWAILLSVNLFNHDVVLADQIFPAHTGGTFSRSSREPKYRIEFHPEDTPFHPDDDQESVVMPNKDGQKFLCFLPKVVKLKTGKPVNQQNTSSVIVETEKRLKLKTPDELLEVLRDRCFIRQEGWWSYEFCYQKKLRQIHVEDEKVTLQVPLTGDSRVYLGEYDNEATIAYNQNLSDISTLKDPRSKDASQRYHAHQYTNGTVCDLTSQPQKPRLFQEERPVWHTIDCNTLPKDYKEPNVDEDGFQREKITMVTDIKYPPGFDAEEYAT